MRREEFEELHYITPITNIPSILSEGLLSYNKARKVKHQTCANEEVQRRRERVVIPSGGRLHDYANLYFFARNPMMFYLLNDGQKDHKELVVLSVSKSVLDIPGAIISDRNASRELALFKPAAEGLKMIDIDMIYAEYWTHDNDIETYNHQGIMCSEVLVPEKVNSNYILKVYVSCEESLKNLMKVRDSANSNIDVIEDGHLFFR